MFGLDPLGLVSLSLLLVLAGFYFFLLREVSKLAEEHKRDVGRRQQVIDNCAELLQDCNEKRKKLEAAREPTSPYGRPVLIICGTMEMKRAYQKYAGPEAKVVAKGEPGWEGVKIGPNDFMILYRRSKEEGHADQGTTDREDVLP